MLIFWLTVGFLFAQPPCQSVTPVDPSYLVLTKKIDKRLNEAPNLAVVAEEADSVLAKLSESKSPVLLAWLKKRQLTDQKEEKIANQWRSYYFKDYILANFPTNNAQVNKAVEGLVLDMHNTYFPSKKRARIETLFIESKEQLTKYIRSLESLDPKLIEQIVKRISGVELSWLDSLASSPFASKPTEFLEIDFIFDQDRNSLSLGALAARIPSEASLFVSLTRQLALRFDPCYWSMQKQNPFETLIQCLRDPKKVGAQKAQVDFNQARSLTSPLTTEQIIFYKKHPQCFDVKTPGFNQQLEQINHAFADWVSAEVFAISRFVGKHPRPDLCQSNAPRSSAFLSNSVRRDRIFLAQPRIAKALKLSTSENYCLWPTNKPKK